MNSVDINKGLTVSQVKERTANGQSNGGFEIKTKSVFRIVCENVFTLFNLINLILAVMVFAVGSYRNALFMGVVICNIAIGIFQSIRAKRAIDKLSIISAPKARVIREGEEQIIPVGDVVLDDIMILSSGMQICADAVVLDGECETDESLITGESDAVFKKSGDELFSGSFVVSGRVKARAVRVGAESASGKITSGSKYIKKTDSEMMKSINLIIKIVSVCIMPFGAVMLFKSLCVFDRPVDEAVTSTAAALIGMIPEGLVLLTGIALAVSAIRLSRRETLCRDLYCVESLARVDVLCLDKTGTLTEGCMEIRNIEPLDGGCSDKELDDALNAFVSAFPEPNSTLKALAERYNNGTAHALRGTVPFSSARKWSAAEFEGLGTLVLGAPEFVLGKGSNISESCEKYTSSGLRTLVLARSPLSPPKETGKLPDDLKASALIVLSDKLRPSAPATLDYFREQGVDIKIISGDDPAAVSQIAKRAGFENYNKYVDMGTVSDEDITHIAEKYSVFGRTTPDQKLLLIKALKAAGHKTAMTGDGVNDVLALREADCSIAMQSGSDAVRAVSQIVLMNSDFSSMPLVVREGRRCINNIRRSASLFLTKTIFSFLLTVVYLFLPLTYPFKPIQLTLISAVIIGIPSFLLAMETNKERVSNGFLSHIFKRSAAGGISAAFGVGLLTAAEKVWGISLEAASTMAMIITAAAFFGTLFEICRPFTKLHAVMYAALVILFAAVALLFPGLFYLVGLSLTEKTILPVLCAVVILLQIILRKLFNNIKIKE